MEVIEPATNANAVASSKPVPIWVGWVEPWSWGGHGFSEHAYTPPEGQQNGFCAFGPCPHAFPQEPQFWGLLVWVHALPKGEAQHL